MSEFERRLEALEQRFEPVEQVPPVRFFTCSGAADDGGPALAESEPGQLVGRVWACIVCSCTAAGLGHCLHRRTG